MWKKLRVLDFIWSSIGILETSLVLKKKLNKYVITIWPSNCPPGIYRREMTFYIYTKTCREAVCYSPKLKTREISNSEQMMEPMVRTDHKTLRRGKWEWAVETYDNMDGSQRHRAEREGLSKHCSEHEPSPRQPQDDQNRDVEKRSVAASGESQDSQ